MRLLHACLTKRGLTDHLMGSDVVCPKHKRRQFITVFIKHCVDGFITIKLVLGNMEKPRNDVERQH